MLSFLPLRFEFGDLAPAMSEATARWHREVEHQRWLDEINRLIARLPMLEGRTIEEILSQPDKVSPADREAVRHFGGGYANHQFMWKILGPLRGTRPEGALAAAIESTWGHFGAFLAAFKAAAMAQHGDSWAFLSLARPRAAEIEIVVLPGNGNVLELKKPGVLVCDLWAHAYETDHRGDRARWLDAYLQVVDWTQCTMRYDLLVAGQHVP